MPNDEIFELVAKDITDGLGTMFAGIEEDTPVIPHPAFDEARVVGNEEVAAVPWVYRCVHTGNFNGLFKTGRRLDIHGVTLVDNRPRFADPPRPTVCYRYVDWMGVATQLGLEVSWRVPVDEDQYSAVLAELHDAEPPPA